MEAMHGYEDRSGRLTPSRCKPHEVIRSLGYGRASRSFERRQITRPSRVVSEARAWTTTRPRQSLGSALSPAPAAVPGGSEYGRAAENPERQTRRLGHRRRPEGQESGGGHPRLEDGAGAPQGELLNRAVHAIADVGDEQVARRVEDQSPGPLQAFGAEAGGSTTTRHFPGATPRRSRSVMFGRGKLRHAIADGGRALDGGRRRRDRQSAGLAESPASDGRRASGVASSGKSPSPGSPGLSRRSEPGTRQGDSEPPESDGAGRRR